MLKFKLTWFFLLPFCRSNCFARRLQHQAVEVSTQFQITKHLNLVVLFQRAIFFGGCFKFNVLKVELDPQRTGDLIIPPGPQFQITKHLN
jgi:hypothetical protein